MRADMRVAEGGAVVTWLHVVPSRAETHTISLTHTHTHAHPRTRDSNI